MTDNYLDPDKYEYMDPESGYWCVCKNEHVCDCVYDPELGRLVPRDIVFDVEQDEE